MYLDLFEFFSKANESEPAKTLTYLLLAVIGSEAYDRLFKESAPYSLNDLTYNDLKAALLRLFGKKK